MRACLPVLAGARLLTSVLAPCAAAEGVAHVTLVILQAPLPSSERVANTVEAVMELGKRGLRNVGREVYYYVQVRSALGLPPSLTAGRADWWWCCSWWTST